MPRLSAEALASPVVNVAHIRISPPAHLEPEAARIFRSIVGTVDAGHFTAADTTLLVEYVRAVVQADLAARRMAAEGHVSDGKVSPWLSVQEKSHRAMASLSVRLRLGPQSRFDRQQAGRNARHSAPLGIEALYSD